MKDWEAAYANEDTPWDKGIAAPPLAQFLSLQSILGSVLVPGCGAGHDVRLLAGQGASVTGMDIAPSAVRKAQSFPVVNDEHYVVADFLNLAEEWQGCFDSVVEHTCLCALELDQRAAYAASIVKALKPGGHYLAIFYREVTGYNEDGPPHPISEQQMHALFGDLFERLDSFVPADHYPSRPHGSEEVVLFRKH
ncbi:MAG TPA: thiopurine S-methyltransferase [Opitutae bacterium]|nr:thiopurine S-methyltransferase [Opitutae bacterium]